MPPGNLVTTGPPATAPAATPLPTRRADQKAWRREQLLDATAEVLVERGRTGVTMEAVAARAGVSKALPYHHFANAGEALVELYNREMLEMARRIARAARGAKPGDDMIRAATRAYFDVVVERGEVLTRLAGPGSDIPAMAQGGPRGAPPFLIDLLRRSYQLSQTEAAVVADLIIGTVTAASSAMGRRAARRRVIEEITTASILGAIHAVEAGPRH